MKKKYLEELHCVLLIWAVWPVPTGNIEIGAIINKNTGTSFGTLEYFNSKE